MDITQTPPGEEGSPQPASNSPKSETTITCDACGSTLYRDGSSKKISDRLKKMMDVQDKAARISELEKENEKLSKRIAELERPQGEAQEQKGKRFSVFRKGAA